MFDIDDDVRRDESDELHGHAGGWYDKDQQVRWRRVSPDGTPAGEFLCTAYSTCDEEPVILKTRGGKFTGDAFCRAHGALLGVTV